MKRQIFTFLIFLFFGIAIHAQKVALVGVSFATDDDSDAIAFVALEELPAGTIIRVTTEEYQSFAGGGGFCDNPATGPGDCMTNEGLVSWTADALIPIGDVIVVKEMSGGNPAVSCSAGSNCGSAVVTGNWNLSNDMDAVYLFEDSDDDISNGVDDVYSVGHYDSGNPSSLPPERDPTGDFPNVIVVLLSINSTTDPMNFGGFQIPDVFRTNFTLTKAGLENPNNYEKSPDGLALDLSIVPFESVYVCGFGAVCPADTDLGTFECGGDLPDPPTVREVNGNMVVDNDAGDYGVNISNNSCGTVRVIVEDDNITSCNQVVTRSITIFDDLNGDETLNAGEESMRCEFTFTYVKPTPVLDSQDEAPTLCSVADNPDGADFSTGIKLAIKNEDALNECNGELTYTLVEIKGADDLIAGDDNAVEGDFGDENLIAGDTWINPTMQQVEVSYTIQALVSFDGGNTVCTSETKKYKAVVLPKPSIEVETDIVGVTYPSSGICDHFDVIMDVKICNDGPVKVQDLAITLNLADHSNGIFYGAAHIIGIVEGADKFEEDLNMENFDGDEDTNLFDDEDTPSLGKGDCVTIRVQWEVAPGEANSPEEASSAEFRARGFAKGDWDNLEAPPPFDDSKECYSDTDYGKEVLGDCWQKSRVAGANDLINVTLNSCEAIITPDMVLENHYSACDQGEEYPLGGFYRVRILYPGELEPRAPAPYAEVDYNDFPDGRVIVYIENVGKACEPLWGEVKLEDKTPPVFTCEGEQFIDYGCREVNGLVYNGNTGAPALNFGVFSCFKEAGMAPESCQRGYALIEEVEPTETGFYTFLLDMPGPGMISIHQNGFDPSEPCSNVIGQSSYINQGGYPIDNDGAIRLTLPLKEDATYDIVITTDGSDCASNVPFTLYAVADVADATLENFSNAPDEKVELCAPLYCGDIDQVLDNEESLKYIPAPEVSVDCGEVVAVWFEDEKDLGSGDCSNELYIYRIWYARDNFGNEAVACTQTIKFRLPRLADIVRPPVTVPIECDEGAPLDEDGHPHPDASGYPYILTLNGIINLNESYCSVGADYRDISVIEVCENTQKIVRQWIILDWCNIEGQYELNNGVEINYRQIIKVGDFTAPKPAEELDEKMYISTGPFGCQGALIIPDLAFTDNCSDEINISGTLYKEIIEDEVDRYGRPTGGTTSEYVKVAEVAEGEVFGTIEVGYVYKLVYTATDNCGNTSDPIDLLIEAKDDTEPIAVCDDDLHISIGGEGIAKVTADAVDEGSWDNCELADVYVSRKLANDDIRDAYLLQIYDLSFDDLVRSGLADKDNSSDAEIWVLDKDGDGEWDNAESDNPELQVVLRFKNDMWFTAWKEDVYFICNDMGDEVTIELLAEDANGNTNRCWLDVLIEDKIAPYCLAPEDVEIDCTELPYGFDPEDDDQLAEIFGEAEAVDNCDGTLSIQNGRSVNWNCNAGTIVRSFQSEDAKGATSFNSCTQTIIVNPVHHYEIKFPKDAAADCNEPSPDSIAATEIGCDLLSVNVTDERFEASGDACYKIKRTYKVINWCEYDGEAPAVVVSRDADCDGTTGEEDVYVLVRPDDGGTITYIDRDNDEENNPSTSPCSNGAEGHYDNSDLNEDLLSVGYWEYAQYIKVYDTTPPAVTIDADEFYCSLDGADCDAPVGIAITVTDICAGDDVTVKVFLDGEQVVVGGAYPNYEILEELEIGEHEVEVHAVDGCQNSSLEIVTIRVIDCKAPSPICIDGLAIELMPTEPNTDADGDGDIDAGAMSIWATDFKVSGLEDCTGEVDLSINRVGETPDRDRKNLVVTCDDPDTLAIEIYAWDSADNPTAVQPDGSIGGANYDHCLTYVLVQDNMFNNCNPSPGLPVAGLITTEQDEPVEEVEVRLSGSQNQVQTTAVDGSYRFDGLEFGDDYTVAPQKDRDYLNGVSTFDLVLITKHLLGTTRLNTPYKLIAADINRSGSVSTLDLIQLRKMVLSIDSKFRNNTSWRFIPSDYVFPSPENPWATLFPEVVSINDIDQRVLNANFIAIKIGDLNGNAVANSLIGEQRDMAGVFKLEVKDRELVAGNEYRIDFEVKNLNVQGYQFTLNHRGLELVDIEYNLAKAEHFGFIEEGVLTTSWNSKGEDGRNFQNSSHLFTLVVRANQNGRLSDLLSVNSRYTRAEAYDSNDKLLDVALSFGEDERNPEDLFHLYQNQPNPFADETIIGFDLPEAMQASITVHDVNGKALKLIRGDYVRGLNQIRLSSEELPASGVLYYTLETDQFTATRKMIILSE